MESLTFHWYGFLIGIAILIGWLACELQAKRQGMPIQLVEQAAWWGVVGGFIGARMWHVATDWQYYQIALSAIFAINKGGASIFGAVLGGVAGMWGWSLWAKKRDIFTQLLDLSVFGLPFAQAVGRLGNYLNQELYGYPTNVPWGIFIDPAKRLAEFSSYDRFHPLFAYEAILMVAFGSFIWLIHQHKTPAFFQLGKTNLFWFYLHYYATVRLLLDFLRPDKANLIGELGVNQVILIGVFILCCWRWWRVYAHKKVLSHH